MLTLNCILHSRSIWEWDRVFPADLAQTIEEWTAKGWILDRAMRDPRDGSYWCQYFRLEETPQEKK